MSNLVSRWTHAMCYNVERIDFCILYTVLANLTSWTAAVALAVRSPV
jgi:hypothetical protein